MDQPNNLPAAVASPPPCARDIDAAVHHHLFPWDQNCCRVCGNLIGATVRWLYGLRSVCTIGSCGSPQGDWKRADELPPPRYSTDPAASKRLRNKMRADGFECMVITRAYEYEALFCRPDDDGETGSVEDGTEEMAVALAALKALGVVLQALPDGGAPQATPE